MKRRLPWQANSLLRSYLKKQKEAFESKKHALLDEVDMETDPRKRTKSLLDGAGKLPSMAANPQLSASNLMRFVEQSAHDPSVSKLFLLDYETALRNELQVQSNKFDFASLYGQLVEEWIASGTTTTTGSMAPDDADYVAVERDESHEQRVTWEEYVFKPKETDAAAIRAYLEGVFIDSSKDAKRAIDSLKLGMESFRRQWDRNDHHFDEGVLTQCLNGMLRVDLLSDEKRSTLRGFLRNKVVLSEIADVLNMRMATRSTWCWDTPLIVQERRNLNGRYRFYPDEDLLHSIFVYYIGRRWAVHLRDQLSRFFASKGVWKSSTKPISKADARRRRYFLDDSDAMHAGSIEKKRSDHFTEDILLDHLPSSMHEVRGVYGEGTETEEDTRLSHVDVIQRLLHRIQSEVGVQTKLGNDVTVIRSDFNIFAVLEFFGVNAEWTDFFRRVLEAPLKFEQDPQDQPAQIRRRGTPLSTPVADFFGEALLFCMDFAVNQKTDGARLYRLHDDMWLWGSDETCSKAWSVMTEFADTVGLDFNEKKTGCTRISGTGAAAPAVVTTKLASGSLPTGDVTWGFLRLDSATGRFLIDQEEVDKHIDELRLQLAACRSIFDWIQAWNIYGSRFFASHFGRPANCYSRAHVDSMLATFQRIQARLFPDHPGGVGEYLKGMMASRFKLQPADIPDGYLYLPTSLGGLGLLNPFVPLLIVKDSAIENPAKIMDDFCDKEEFETSEALGRAYESLMEEPTQISIRLKGDVKASLTSDEEWYGFTEYEQWIVQLYHKSMVALFGGLSIVDEGLLPTGLMTMLRQSRFRWQG
ncbi:hypothetical protein B0H63DRAFT_502624 [Podospora didyma]|uniref:Reverse transcriptase domain-containing protein n=1 Tax=Podospora didyma TaxID=330526 RepID=A0AAE0ND32_9PEZI|nr:hypothetical protein B0H63DRAFT_502624 [Podospora didyma]